MKQIKTVLKALSFTAALFITSGSIAQSKKIETNKLHFKPGQKFQTDNSIKTTSSMEMMGQQVDIKADVTLVRQLEIKDKKDKLYNVASTITKMTTNMDMMGQTIAYDSDKKEDADSDIGKILKDKINVPTALEMDEDGKIIPSKKEETKAVDDASGMAAMLKNFGAGSNDAILTDDLFIQTPKNLKVGDTWSDSLITDGQKMYRDYTVKSIQGNEAIVTIGGKSLTDKKMENQGMEMNLVMESKVTGEMTVDSNTGVIKQRTITVDGSGNIEMMGQQVPMATKVESNSVTKGL